LPAPQAGPRENGRPPAQPPRPHRRRRPAGRARTPRIRPSSRRAAAATHRTRYRLLHPFCDVTGSVRSFSRPM